MGQYMAGDYSVCLASIPCVMVAESCGVSRSFQPMRVTMRRVKDVSRSMWISAYMEKDESVLLVRAFEVARPRVWCLQSSGSAGICRWSR